MYVKPTPEEQCLDTDVTRQYIRAMRLFEDEPKWTPLNRAPGLEDNPNRKKYLQNRRPENGMMT